MAISMSRYVAITSGVGGGTGVRKRDLIGRLFTTNPLVPAGTVLEFESADDVLSYFGSTSEEYKRAKFYFGWISKTISKARKISFYRWADADDYPRIYGAAASKLATLKQITSGGFSITLGANTNAITGLNFSSASSFADVASAIQTKLRAATGTQFASATVTYNATSGGFDVVGSVAEAADVAVTAASSNDAASSLGWLTGAIMSPGVAETAVADTLSASADLSTNFASFLFLPALTEDQVVEAATWNDTQNVMYHYCVPTLAVDASDMYDLLKSISGVSLTLSEVSGEYPEMVPMIVLAATDYAKRGSTSNYMFQMFGLTPSVTTNTDANTYDAIRVNYYGRTQTAGQNIDFYQRGVMCGLSTDPVDMNTYNNEIWFKDRCGSAIMELLLALAKVSANTQGRSQIMTVVQSAIDEALFNGVISVGKPLTTTQKLYITTQTGDDLAWIQVQNIGYWLDCTVESYTTTDSRTEYKAVYACIYSKDDCIRKVEGTHTLI